MLHQIVYRPISQLRHSWLMMLLRKEEQWGEKDDRPFCDWPLTCACVHVCICAFVHVVLEQVCRTCLYTQHEHFNGHLIVLTGALMHAVCLLMSINALLLISCILMGMREWTYMRVQCLLTNPSKWQCEVACQWSALLFLFSAAGPLNKYSQLLRQILILKKKRKKNHPHSVWHFSPNWGAYTQVDNGSFSLVKCSASVLNSMLIMLTTCQGFWNDKIWSKFQHLCSILLCRLRHCRRGVFHSLCNDGGKARWCLRIIC